MSKPSLPVEQIADALGLTSDELAKMVADVKKKRIEEAQLKVGLFRFIASQPRAIGAARIYPSLSDAKLSGAVQLTPDGVVIGGIKLDQDAGMAILQAWERYETELECAQEDLDPGWEELPLASVRQKEEEHPYAKEGGVAQALQGIISAEMSRKQDQEARDAKKPKTSSQPGPHDLIASIFKADQERKKRLGFTD